MYRNQYTIVDGVLPNAALQKYSFNSLSAYAHSSLPVNTARGRSELLLIGYIIDPLKPHRNNDDIVQDLARTCCTKESLFKELQALSGRYVVLYKNGRDHIALHDACGLRQLFYSFDDNQIILSSSPKMALDLLGKISRPADVDVLHLKEYKANEHWLIGDKCIDDRFRKLLPNHFLDLISKKKCRIPLFPSEVGSESAALEYASTVLEGSIDAITRRYQVVQPLTAGWDSRTLLSAAKKYKDQIQFYVFDYSRNNKLHPDVAVSQNLSEKLGLRFDIIQPEEPYQDFLREYRNEHLVPRVQANTAEIQYHYRNNRGRNIVRISGVGEEIVRCFYGYTGGAVTVSMLDHFSGYSGKSSFITGEITNWLNDASGYAKEYGIPVLDLFYWEQRVANLAAQFLFEQDIAIEDFCPLCNKSLVLALLKIDPKKRSSPKYSFIRRIINALWAECLTEPINPAGFIKYLRRSVKRHSVLRYFNLRSKSLRLFPSA